MSYLLEKSEVLVENVQTSFFRGLYSSINWKNRLIGIKGARGTGKTTLLLQRLKELGKSPSEAMYVSLDDLYFSNKSLIEIITSFYKQGGRIVFLDEVHKYPDWAKHIKNSYDYFADLQIAFTGSSIIDIAREEADLSRRVRMYELPGLSYREYLAFAHGIQMDVIELNDLLSPKNQWKSKLPTSFKPLQHFQSYLSGGYYPFFKEDEEGFHDRVKQMIRMIVEYDMAELHDFDIRNAKKMLQLLYILSVNVPFKPNISSLAEKSQIHRNSIINYLHFLEQAKLIKLLYSTGISVSVLQKPEKIYLENTNLAYALSEGIPDKGNLRETFFMDQLSINHKVSQHKNADFIVDDKWVIEIGGKNKGTKQIENLKNAYRVLDDVDFTLAEKSIPLWTFGFLY